MGDMDVKKSIKEGLNKYVIPTLAMWAKAWDLYLLRPATKAGMICYLKPV